MNKLLCLVIVSVAFFSCDMASTDQETAVITPAARVNFITSEECDKILKSGNIPFTGLYLVDMTAEPENLNELLMDEGFFLRENGDLVDEDGDMVTLFKKEFLQTPVEAELLTGPIDNKDGAHALAGKLVYVRILADIYFARDNLKQYVKAYLKIYPLTINSTNTKVLPLTVDHIIATIKLDGYETSQGGPNVSSAVNKRKRRDRGGQDDHTVNFRYLVVDGNTTCSYSWYCHYFGDHWPFNENPYFDFYHLYNGKIKINTWRED